MSGGTNLNSLLEEAQQMLGTVAEVLTSTMQQGMEVIKNYEELANDKVSWNLQLLQKPGGRRLGLVAAQCLEVVEITKTEKKKLAELSGYSESVKSCSEKRRIDFNKVEEKLKKELAACYKKHYGSLDKIIADKSAIHDEAERLKNDLQKAMADCVSSANKTGCFVEALNDLRKRLKLISARMTDTLNKETEARVKATKAVYECDKKALDEAYKKCNAIVEELKKCADKEK